MLYKKYRKESQELLDDLWGNRLRGRTDAYILQLTAQSNLLLCELIESVNDLHTKNETKSEFDRLKSKDIYMKLK